VRESGCSWKLAVVPSPRRTVVRDCVVVRSASRKCRVAEWGASGVARCISREGRPCGRRVGNRGFQLVSIGFVVEEFLAGRACRTLRGVSSADVILEAGSEDGKTRVSTLLLACADRELAQVVRLFQSGGNCGVVSRGVHGQRTASPPPVAVGRPRIVACFSGDISPSEAASWVHTFGMSKRPAAVERREQAEPRSP